MPAEKLTQTFLANVERPASGTLRVRDTLCRGLYAYVGRRSVAFVLRREVDGVTRPVRLGEWPAMTVTQAREAADRLRAQIGSQGAGAFAVVAARRVVPTLGEALEAYLRFRQATGRRLMKDSTAKSMREYFRHLADWQDRRISTFRTAEISTRHLELTEARGPYAANRVMAYLSSVLGWAIYHFAADDDSPLLPANPVQVLTRRRQWNQESRRQTYVAPAALPQFWQAVHALPGQARHLPEQAQIARDCLIVALFTGMRPNEVQRLRVDGVDLARRVFCLQDTKNHDDFELPFAATVGEVLRRRVEYACGIGAAYVFPSSGTNPRSQRETIHMRSYVEKIDAVLGGFVAKDLRRTFETLVGNMTPAIPLMVQKRLLNHRTRVVDADVTSGYYVADVEEIRPHVEQIAQRILALVQAPVPPAESSAG